MAKLKDDPKVQELIAKEVAAAIKAERKAVQATIKSAIAGRKEAGCKNGVAALKDLGQQLKAA